MRSPNATASTRPNRPGHRPRQVAHAGGPGKLRAIILGGGGDCCIDNRDLSQGTIYEGAMVSGYPSDATDNAVRANIVAAGYR
jgi:hypothetical protein